ncbi:hypothetical protein VOLCADRAFT_98274 [Volvox carteri f. nagariensis]|uniref:Uncharacterized protein n=1 Tax=Volvox carteri f. nagariensis TaxID=3068 RepID=D8UF14_VOLCA|nr:uncharacterized protein VOLCADRAFT_98274 [Volvox carteri f. nagariensis]EFJ41691.1 hypothetical protein VOLCADRAFT_98274 [Volvox carteri f. nagariensis]|eukprot:XP_002957193.1 hypothetical protein VOLCADRAFT_98274 [Volvox carteri f. nagariensis]
MSTCELPGTDAAQKVEELRRALDRSQALLADIEAKYARRPAEESTAAVVDSIMASASDNEPSEDDEVPLEQPRSPLKSRGGLNVFKSRLTQWFGGKRFEKAAKRPAETAPRTLSFSRVNIGFPADATATESPEVLAELAPSTSPQLPSRLFQRSWTSNAARHPASGPVANRATSFTATALPAGSSMYGNSTAAASCSSAAASSTCIPLVPQPPPPPQQQQPKPSQLDAAPPAVPIVTRRASSGPSSNRLIPTLAASASSSSQSQRRIVFRDTVWAPLIPSDSSPNDPLRPRRPSSSLRNSRDSDNAVPAPYNLTPISPQAVRTNSAMNNSSSCSSSITTTTTSTTLMATPSTRNTVRWAMQDKDLLEAQLPQVYSSTGSSRSQQQMFVASANSDDPHQRSEPSVVYARARSFTTAVAGPVGSPGSRSGTQRALTHGSVGTEDALRRTLQVSRAPQSLTSSSSRPSSGTVTLITGGQMERTDGDGVPGSVPGTAAAEPCDQEVASELSPTSSTADGTQGNLLQKQQQQQQQQQDYFMAAQYAHDVGKPLWASLRLAGIPEAGSGGGSGSNPAPRNARSGWRRSIDFSSLPHHLTFSPAPTGPAAPAAGAAAATLSDTAAGSGAGRGRSARRQTWSNNEVFIPARE